MTEAINAASARQLTAKALSKEKAEAQEIMKKFHENCRSAIRCEATHGNCSVSCSYYWVTEQSAHYCASIVSDVARLLKKEGFVVRIRTQADRIDISW